MDNAKYPNSFIKFLIPLYVTCELILFNSELKLITNTFNNNRQHTLHVL